ncbi:glycosyltransferase family 4 protein [bacterium]|nr:glycosyltransferase family 4 protein [bacterium]
MKRRVLMISHGYPPVGGSGMLRTLKFSKYLPALGWQPQVLTLQRTRHPRMDPRLLAEVPAGTAVHRSPVWNPLDLLLWLKSLPARLAPRPAPAPGGGKARAPEAAEESGGGEAERGGPLALIVDLCTTPDGYSGWLGPGLAIGVWALLRHRPRVIYSTSPPPTAHLIGGLLAGLARRPWVVDFRDPWTLQFREERLAARKGRWNRRLEHWVLRRAHTVICNTEPLAAAFRAAHPELPAERFVVITNGFDPEDFAAEPGAPPAEGPFRFVHTGEFFPLRNLRVPDPFLAALRDLAESGRLDPATVRVRLVGSGDYTRLPQFAAQMRSPALAQMVEVVDFLPHGEIPGELAASHALLLFQNGESFRMQVPAKTFEYIRAARPILAIAAPGATADLVASVSGGRAVRPEDAAGIARAILALIAERGTLPARGEDELERFGRPGLARRLAGVLDAAAGFGAQRGPA